MRKITKKKLTTMTLLFAIGYIAVTAIIVSFVYRPNPIELLTLSVISFLLGAVFVIILRALWVD